MIPITTKIPIIPLNIITKLAKKLVTLISILINLSQLSS